jgi:hypothetical protein
MPAPTLVLRRANLSRISGQWQDEDYDVFDGTGGTERDVERIFQQADGRWFWGVSFQLTDRKSYGHATSLDEAKAAFKAEYEAWQSQTRIEPDARRTQPAPPPLTILDHANKAPVQAWAFFLQFCAEQDRARCIG